MTQYVQFELKEHDVRQSNVNWQSYMENQVISVTEYDLLVKLEECDLENAVEVIKESPAEYGRIFHRMLTSIQRDLVMQYIVTKINDIIEKDPSTIEIFRLAAKENEELSFFTVFITMLCRPDNFTVQQVARIIVKVIAYNNGTIDECYKSYFLEWFIGMITDLNNHYIFATIRTIQTLVQIREMRRAFFHQEGVSSMLNLLGLFDIGYQMQYCLVLCLWIMTFDNYIADQICEKHNKLIPILSAILVATSKEKVTRVIMATFRNLLEKTTDCKCRASYMATMERSKVLAHIKRMENRRIYDVDLSNDMKYVENQLMTNVHEFSSYDDYVAEIMSGIIEWTPVHKSRKFWRENVERFNKDNFRMLRCLIDLLKRSQNPLVLAVCAHDLGEYIKYYPQGKGKLEALGGKNILMQLVNNEDNSVCHEALQALQKLMIYNWEFFKNADEINADAADEQGTDDGATKHNV